MENPKLGQLVWYMLDGKVHSASVLSVMTVQNAHDDWAHTKEQKHTFQRFGESRTMIATVHATLDATEVFDNKSALLESV